MPTNPVEMYLVLHEVYRRTGVDWGVDRSTIEAEDAFCDFLDTLWWSAGRELWDHFDKRRFRISL